MENLSGTLHADSPQLSSDAAVLQAQLGELAPIAARRLADSLIDWVRRFVESRSNMPSVVPANNFLSTAPPVDPFSVWGSSEPTPSIAPEAPWPSVGWGFPVSVSIGSPASVVTPRPHVRRLLHGRKNRARQARTSHALITECVRQIWALNGIPDKKAAEKMIRHFRASLRPRQHRGPEDETREAARMRLAGKEWPDIYLAIWPDPQTKPYQKSEHQRSQERERLRRNTNEHLRKLMRKDGAPKGQGVRDWLSLKRQAGCSNSLN